MRSPKRQQRQPVSAEMTDAQVEAVTQGTRHMNPFNADVPTLTTADGTEYIPIRALCELLGLAPATWIGTVCGCYRGQDRKGMAVRRLPYRTEDGQIRAEWCLDQYHVLRWLTVDLNEIHVPQGERHDQLWRVQTQMMDVADQRYQRRQEDFHATKRVVIRYLKVCAATLHALIGLDSEFGPHLEQSAPTAAEGRAARAELAAFIAAGRGLYEQLADALRAVLQQMTDEPVFDALQVDEATGEVIDTVAMPILPRMPDLRDVMRLSDMAHRWLTEDLSAWLEAHGIDARDGWPWFESPQDDD